MTKKKQRQPSSTSNTEKIEKIETIATMGHVKRLVRRRLSQREEEEHGGLNIYPMMDMMTILLVFMVMQFASSSAAVIQENEELRIPYSTSSAVLEDAVPVQISRNSVVVDGHAAVDLQNGRVDAADKQGGSTGFLITSLHRDMCRIRDLKKDAAEQIDARVVFQGNVQIIADRRTPFRTISEVVYTAGQCGFKNLRFTVNKRAE